jgi:hypothetical protein
MQRIVPATILDFFKGYTIESIGTKPPDSLLSRALVQVGTDYLMVYVTLTVTEICVCPGWIGTEAFGAAAPPPPIP